MGSLCLVVTLVAWYYTLRGRAANKAKLSLILRIKQAHLAWIAWTAGLRIESEGELAWPSEPFLLIANHVSYWDIIALASLYPMAFVAKSEISTWPLVGFLISQCQTLYVERGTGQGRIRALHDLRKRLQECPVCIFPEGTTSSRVAPVWTQWYRGQISVLKKPGVPVYTLALHYKDQEQCAWIDDDALIPHLWRCLLRPTMHLTVTLQRLSVPERPKQPLGPVAEQAFLQTKELCHRLASHTGDETRHPWGEGANFSLVSGLTKK
jgi:1-acyl-sn-glycerol-3-phosphate acyltransferase